MSHIQRTQFDSISRQMFDLSPNASDALLSSAVKPELENSDNGLRRAPIISTFPTGVGHHAFRVIATRLRRMRREQKLQRIMITSALASEGKTFIAANLAIVLGMNSQERTLLVEGDLRQPSFPQVFKDADPAGLNRWFQEEKSENLNTWVLPAGEPIEDPTTLLDSDRLSELMHWASHRFDWIIIDSPPVVPVGDASFWGRYVDGVILVVSDGKTPKKLLQSALENLDTDRLIGTVLNDAIHLDKKAYPYDHYYYSAVNRSTSRSK